MSGTQIQLTVYAMAFLTGACDFAEAAEHFAQFRGNSGTGVVEAQPIATSWSQDKNVVWKVPSPGAGWSQPIIWGDHVYITAAVADGDVKPRNFADGVKSPQSMGVSLFAKAPNITMDWQVFCLNLADGSTSWTQSVISGKPKFPIHPSNSWATETPAADENGLYVYFGATGVVAGLSHDGSIRWSANVGVFKTSNGFGTGSSLTIHEGKVFVQNLSEQSATITCFETVSGKELWKATRSENSTSWSTPLIWKNAHRVELIVSGGEEITSYDPSTGTVIWTLKNVKAATACSPCADNDRLYFGGSDPFSKGPLFAVEAGGQGDLSPKKKNDKFTSCSWLSERNGPGMSSPISSGQYVYSTDSNILKCFDAMTGERIYQNRLPGLNMVAASPLLIGNSILLIDENGRACFVKGGPEFEVIGTGELPDTFWSTPAVANGSIVFRGVESIYCVRSRAGGNAGKDL
jgi:hypothetical protein